MKFEIYNENGRLRSKTDLTEFFYLLENMRELDQESIENILKFVLLNKRREDVTLYANLRVMYSKTIFYAESDEFMDIFMSIKEPSIDTLIRIVSKIGLSKTDKTVSFKKFGKIFMVFNIMDLARLHWVCSVSPMNMVSHCVEFDECKLTKFRAGVNLLSLYNDSKHIVDLLIPDDEYFKKRKLKFEYNSNDIEILSRWLYFVYSKGDPSYDTLDFKVKYKKYYETKLKLRNDVM